jgi:hypothetical protein
VSRPISSFAVFACLLASTLSQAQTANCTEWNFFQLPAPWTAFIANGINRWGTVTGWGWKAGFNVTQFAFVRYKGGGVTSFMAPGASWTIFEKRNRFGVTVGTYDVTSATGRRVHGLVVSGNNSVTVDFPFAHDTYLLGINSYGAIVGSHATKSGITDGFKLKDGTFRRVHYPNSISTAVYDINDKGTIIGSYQDQNNQGHGFIRENGIYKTLDNPQVVPPEVTGLNAINGSGTIVGSFYNGPIPESFLYSNGVFKKISHPNIFYTFVTGINAFNYVVGTTNLNSGGMSMFTAHCE